MRDRAAALPLSTTEWVQPFWELTKPRITALVLLTTAAGFYLGSSGTMHWPLLFHAVFGTFLVASGTAVLNQYLERENDARMRRTASRPLPSGRLSPIAALIFGLMLVIGGVGYLGVFTNALTAGLGAITSAVYLLVYTPLKTRTTLCTSIGAIPGAAPPLMGWAAASGQLGWDAWILFGVLFFWQYPHFLSIAWVYKDDYQRGGFKMLPLGDPEGSKTAAQVVIFGGLLLGISMIASVAGIAGMAYLVGASLLGVIFLTSCLKLARQRTLESARVVLRTSVVYLPLLLILMVIDKG